MDKSQYCDQCFKEYLTINLFNKHAKKASVLSLEMYNLKPVHIKVTRLSSGNSQDW